MTHPVSVPAFTIMERKSTDDEAANHRTNGDRSESTKLDSQLSNFEQFMETGDKASSNRASGSSSANAQQNAQQNAQPSSSGGSDAFESPENEPAPTLQRSDEPHTPTQNTVPRPTAAASPQAQAGAFFTGLFRKAAASFESTLESAKRDISRNEVFSSAQESLTELGQAIVPSLGGSSNDRARRNSASNSENGQYPEKTIPLRTLRINQATGAEPLLLFVNGANRDTIVVTESTIEAYERDGTKILQANMEVTWSGDSDAQGNAPNGTSESHGTPRQSSLRTSRVHARSPSDVIKAICAVHVPATEEVIVGHADGALRIYSLRSGQMGARIREGAANESTISTIGMAPVRPSRLLVGDKEGRVHLVEVADLRRVATLNPPEMCETPLGAGTKNAPVSCVVGVKLQNQTSQQSSASPLPSPVIVGYDDGIITMNMFGNTTDGVPFSAHASKVNGAISLYGGALIVSIGSEEDTSLSACVSENGRCLIRRVLPYTPTCICRVPAAKGAHQYPNLACPSENVFIVGGDEGQVDVFRLVVLSPHKVEIRLVRKISDRTRGRRRTVVQALYMPEEATLTALVRSGEIRRWKLSRFDACALSLPEEDLQHCTYNADNIAAALSDNSEERDETRLAGVEGVIAAQRILAAALEDDIGVGEEHKDDLVAEFQKKQAEMQETASQADAELRRAKRRIASRFARGLMDQLPNVSATEKRLALAARRTAAFELDFVTKRHTETLLEIRTSTVARLRVVLLDYLRNATGAPERVEALRKAAEELTVHTQLSSQPQLSPS